MVELRNEYICREGESEASHHYDLYCLKYLEGEESKGV
jgi:hypothetical protein